MISAPQHTTTPFLRHSCTFPVIPAKAGIHRQDLNVSRTSKEIDNDQDRGFDGGDRCGLVDAPPRFREDKLNRNGGIDSRFRGNDERALSCTLTSSPSLGAGIPSLK